MASLEQSIRESLAGTMAAFNSAGDTLDVMMEEIKSHVREFNKQAGVMQSLKAFASAVDWTERWIQGLMAFHALLLVSVLALRRNQVYQGVVFFAIMIAVYCSERLNGLLAQHWQRFARQPYFDPHGVFFSAVYSVPLLVVMFVVLINYLVHTSQLLIAMKRKQLRYELRQRARAQQGRQQDGQPPGGVEVGASASGKKDQ